MRPFLDQRTIDKLVSVRGTAAEVERALVENHDFPPAVAEWVRRAMERPAAPGPDALPPLPLDAARMQLPRGPPRPPLR